MSTPPAGEDHARDDTFHVFGDRLPAPRSGDDATFEVLDQAITALGFIRHLWMGDDKVMIHIIASLIDQAQRCLTHLIAEARHDASSWTDIATLLGTSPQQAKLRFDPDSPTADQRPMLD